MTSTGSPSGPKARTSAAVPASGRNQCTTLRSTRSSGASAGASSGSQGPARQHEADSASRVSPATRPTERPRAVRLPAVDDDPRRAPRRHRPRATSSSEATAAGGQQPRRRAPRPNTATATSGMRTTRMTAHHLRGRRASRAPGPASRALARAPLTSHPSRRADHQTAGRHQPACVPLRALQRAPLPVRPLHQRHVERILEVGLADDPRPALRRAAACGSVNRSIPSTCPPRRASSATLAAPIAPRPTTIASQEPRRDEIRLHIEVAVECPLPAPKLAALTGGRSS